MLKKPQSCVIGIAAFAMVFAAATASQRNALSAVVVVGVEEVNNVSSSSSINSTAAVASPPPFAKSPSLNDSPIVIRSNRSARSIFAKPSDITFDASDDELVVDYRCYQERSAWRLYMIPHVGVRVRTNRNNEYFIENNGRGALVYLPRATVSYKQLLANWEWQHAQWHPSLREIIRRAPRNYNLLYNNCYLTQVEVLKTLSPLPCNSIRCEACGWTLFN